MVGYQLQKDRLIPLDQVPPICLVSKSVMARAVGRSTRSIDRDIERGFLQVNIHVITDEEGGHPLFHFWLTLDRYSNRNDDLAHIQAIQNYQRLFSILLEVSQPQPISIRSYHQPLQQAQKKRT